MLDSRKSVLLLSYDASAVAEMVSSELSKRLGFRVNAQEGRLPDLPRRDGQINAESLIRELEARLASSGCGIVLGITTIDLYVPGKNFVFGLASSEGAVVSVFRLQSLDPLTHRSRVLKEVTHELGHVLGLEHCPHSLCVMHFSNTLADTDRKGTEFCHECASRLEALTGLDEVPSQLWLRRRES